MGLGRYEEMARLANSEIMLWFETQIEDEDIYRRLEPRLNISRHW